MRSALGALHQSSLVAAAYLQNQLFNDGIYSVVTLIIKII